MKKNDIFWGVLFILAAALIVVSKLGFLVGISIIEVILTVLLVGILISNVVKLKFSGILFPVAFLAIIYAEELQIQDLTPWPVLAVALLGSIGLNLIFKPDRWHFRHHKHGKFGREWSVDFENKTDKHYDKVINEQDGNVIRCSQSFGSTIKYINTDNFERADIECSFGAMKVYFDNALIQSGHAQIDLDVSFSGVELFIPKTWNVIDKVDTSFGSMQEKNRRGDSQAPVVTITGDVSFGGVEIIYI
jgi:hypothetical protein